MNKGTCERSIFIDIREWFDRVNGNTYFSAIVSVDGEWQFTTGMQYGYGDQALYEAAKVLEARGFVVDLDDHRAFTIQAREAGIDLYYARLDCLKRELPKAASRWEQEALAKVKEQLAADIAAKN